MTTPTPWWRCIGGTILALALAATAGAAEKWIRLEADGVTVYSEATQGEASELLVNYLGYRHTFETLFGQADHPLGPVHVLLYRNQKSLGKIAADNPDPMMMTTALSAAVDGDVAVALSVTVERQKALRSIFEFDTIMGLQRTGYFLPLWMEQGTGVVMSTLDLEKDGCVVGSTVDWMAGKLGNEQWLSWEKVSGIRLNTSAYGTPATFQLFTAQSWALMRTVLQQDPARARERFLALVEEVRKNHQAEAAVAKVLQLDRAAVTAAVKRQLRPAPKIVVPFDREAAASHIKVTPAPEEEVDVAIASLMLVHENRSGADVLLQRAFNLAPEAPLVLEALARREMLNRDNNRAAGYYRAAVAAGTKNPRAYIMSAQGRLNDVMSNGSDQPGQGGSPVVEALGEVRQALKFNPGDGEAYVLLGRALYVSETLTAADLAELTPGFGSRDRGFLVKYFHALLLLRLDQYPEAVAELRQLLQDDTVPADKRQELLHNFAAQNFGLVKTRVEQQVHARDFDAARALLDQRLDPTEWTVIAEPVAALRKWAGMGADLDALEQLEGNGRPEDLRKARQAFVAKYPDEQVARRVQAMLEAEPKPAPEPAK